MPDLDFVNVLRLFVGGVGLLFALAALRIAWLGRRESARAWGLISWAAFALIATADQWARYHDPVISWRLPAFIVALGLAAIYLRASLRVDWHPPHRR